MPANQRMIRRTAIFDSKGRQRPGRTAKIGDVVVIKTVRVHGDLIANLTPEQARAIEDFFATENSAESKAVPAADNAIERLRAELPKLEPGTVVVIHYPSTSCAGLILSVTEQAVEALMHRSDYHGLFGYRSVIVPRCSVEFELWPLRGMSGLLALVAHRQFFRCDEVALKDLIELLDEEDISAFADAVADWERARDIQSFIRNLEPYPKRDALLDALDEALAKKRNS